MAATNTSQAPFDLLVEYERQSIAHDPGRPDQVEAPGHWRGVGFRVGERRLLVSFEEVVEIIPLPPTTQVPGSAHWMLGVANVRGNLLPVVDLKQFMDGERTVLHEATRVLVVRQVGGNVAVLIDELFGQRSFDSRHEADPSELAQGRFNGFINQAYRVGDTTWGVFAMALLTRTPEFRQAAA